ncbi:MAG: hypothetical protein ACRDVN_14315 [Jiangellaceae bacterium]
MGYVACRYIDGTAHVADHDELAAVAWASPDELEAYVPYGFAPVVTDYLNNTLRRDHPAD